MTRFVRSSRGAQRRRLFRQPIVLFVVVVGILLLGTPSELNSYLSKAPSLPTSQVEKGSSSNKNEPEHDNVIHKTELYVYNEQMSKWADFETNMMVLQDDKLVSDGTVVPIGVAHGQGLLHRGIWIAVLRPTQEAVDMSIGEATTAKKLEMLFLKRGPHLKTCPSAWGLVGEHSDPGEPWEVTAKRALREEIQLKSAVVVLHNSSHMATTSKQQANPAPILTNLFPGKSLLVRTHYENVQKYELQATAVFALAISRSEKLQFDEEVAETKWVPLDRVLLQTAQQICNEDIYALLLIVTNQILE